MIHVCGNSKQIGGWPENQGAADNLVVQWLNFSFSLQALLSGSQKSFNSFTRILTQLLQIIISGKNKAC